MSLVIEARELSRAYNENGATTTGLDQVSLAIETGEYVAIVGPSGCGKSTLLHLLGGLDQPSSGEVWFNGGRLDQLSEAARAVLRRRGIGFVFQFFNLVGNLSAADNIELPALIAGQSPSEARHRREQLTSDLGIADRAAAVPGRLSGGEQQRVAIARALVNEPLVLLADEPTGNLDSAASAEVMALLRELNDRGQTVVMVTHDPEVAAEADRVIRLRDGRVEADERTAPESGQPPVRSGPVVTGA